MGYLRIIIYGIVILYVVFKLLRKFYFSGGKCPKKYIHNLNKKTILITGGSSGIGLAAAKEYVKYNAKKVIICSRSSKRGKEAEKILRKVDTITPRKTIVEFIQLDLSSLNSIESVAKRVEDEKIDVLILNAACFTPGKRKVSEHGTELMYSVGFLGHFHLVNLLFENFVKRDVKVIATTGGQKMMPLRIPSEEEVFGKMENVGFMEVFGLAKTSVMLFMKYLDKKFSEEDSMSSAYYLHPGVSGAGQMGIGDQKVPLYFKILKTLVMGPISSIVGKTDEEICQTHLYLTFAPRNVLKGGGYYVDCKYTKELDFFCQEENIEKVWVVGNEIIKKIKEKEVEEEEED